MIPDVERTIVALASGAGPSPRAILRITGPGTQSLLAKLCNLPERSGLLSAVRLTTQSVMCWIPEIARSLSTTLYYWPDSRSYTGQPAAELHMIGCLPLAEAMIARCCQLGARPAERGEFTLRAFLAGKLDLAQAEAVLGVIEAENMESLKIALGQLGGNLATEIEPLRATIVFLLAELEAGLDFVDEDIEFISRESITEKLAAVHDALLEFQSRLATRSSTDGALQIVLVGLPNSGKSSLFNALCRRELSIVADVPGTTRDYLQQRVDFPPDHNGSPITADLIDTAGWEQLEGDSPRAMAQQQQLECLQRADVCLLCVDGSATCDEEKIKLVFERASRSAQHWILVGTKSDLPGFRMESLACVAQMITERRCYIEGPICVSNRTGMGLERVRQAISRSLNSNKDRQSSPLTMVRDTAVRCRASVDSAIEGVRSALELAKNQAGEELISAELRLVLDDLASIIGKVHSDDILGEIFSRFCIGK